MRSKKAVSSILGTILIISITLALGGLLYGYSKGLFGNLSTNEDLTTNFQLQVTPAGSYLLYSLKDDGNVALHLEYIVLNGSNLPKPYKININETLQPGQQIQNVTWIPGTLVSGNYYTVIVYAILQNGQIYDTISSVLAAS
ncbi:hypothetical protein GWK48_04205 [Metallosphaera tengchongensis]|uniref:Uncharacterized protein n=2 Tax=Metallosphaera tengchongensis TaxID=1532350 RepID=A0A6N0NXM0_9CREN|nr:hypothetical protein GWK48_04205 [Metallosphaera tengchongensis]